jgi:hypothetical protein
VAIGELKGQILKTLHYVTPHTENLQNAFFAVIKFTFGRFIKFYSFRSPSLFCLSTVGVEVVYFHLITLKHTSQSVGLLWTRDRPVAETYTWQHKHCTRQTSMPPVGFEPAIPARARPQTYALDRAATGVGENFIKGS